MFQLHPQLKKDCIEIGRFSLCRLLLMNDRTFPWFILVPERGDVSEIHQLSEDDQGQFIKESCYLSQRIAALYSADKINIAALGNLVPQLHIHHVVRYRNDPAWPAPIWGKFAAQAYGAEGIAAQKKRLRAVLTEHFAFL